MVSHRHFFLAVIFGIICNRWFPKTGTKPVRPKHADRFVFKHYLLSLSYSLENATEEPVSKMDPLIRKTMLKKNASQKFILAKIVVL